ncbi:hypothetical protein Tco_1115128 [Tanacetum coccineum]
MMDNRDNRRWDVFGASVIIRRHRILCDLGFTFYYFRRGSSMNRESLPLRRLGNLPSIHLEFEELELDRLELDKQEVEQHEVDRFDLAEPGVGKLKLD